MHMGLLKPLGAQGTYLQETALTDMVLLHLKVT